MDDTIALEGQLKRRPLVRTVAAKTPASEQWGSVGHRQRHWAPLNGRCEERGWRGWEVIPTQHELARPYANTDSAPALFLLSQSIRLMSASPLYSVLCSSWFIRLFHFSSAHHYWSAFLVCIVANLIYYLRTTPHYCYSNCLFSCPEWRWNIIATIILLFACYRLKFWFSLLTIIPQGLKVSFLLSIIICSFIIQQTKEIPESC